ncbi:hypothetical protein QR685DRAFT_570082 [Neurospora intermedia]|uniref:Uncharacterized protein n=1 Tax=Neurospora intermedia TaxID=5142 RepID=A0ABR3DN78_NEUIN
MPWVAMWYSRFWADTVNSSRHPVDERQSSTHLTQSLSWYQTYRPRRFIISYCELLLLFSSFRFLSCYSLLLPFSFPSFFTGHNTSSRLLLWGQAEVVERSDSDISTSSRQDRTQSTINILG